MGRLGVWCATMYDPSGAETIVQQSIFYNLYHVRIIKHPVQRLEKARELISSIEPTFVTVDQKISYQHFCSFD
jgi:hypothetical protein